LKSDNDAKARALEYGASFTFYQFLPESFTNNAKNDIINQSRGASESG